MKKAELYYEYADMHDGEKIEATVKVYASDLTKDLGQKFVFIEVVHVESERTICEEISIPLKAIPKLIEALQKVSR